MRFLSTIRFLTALLLAAQIPAEAQKPVLAWSAKLGPTLTEVTGTAVATDGSIYLVARTDAGHIFAGKLSSDGATSVCSMTLGGRNNESPSAMALAPDGTILITGFTNSPDFPASILQPGQSPTTFLLRLDPCTKTLRYSTYLPVGVKPAALVAANDGSAYLAARDGDSDNGFLLRISAAGSSVLTKTALRGIPGAVALDSNNSVYVTGLLPAIKQNEIQVRQAFASKLSADLQTVVYDVNFGTGPIAMGTSLIVDQAGSLYAAGMARPPGSQLYNGITLPSFNSAAILARILPDGKVDFDRFVEFASDEFAYTDRRPVGIGIGPDSRIWLAITGPAGFPRNLLSPDQVAISGVLLRSFLPNGDAAGGETIVPGLAAAAFGTNGRISVVGINRNLPTTMGSATVDAVDSLSAIAFDLNSINAPAVIADYDILNIDELNIAPGFRVRNGKQLHLQMEGAAQMNYVAALSVGSVFADNLTGKLPATITIDSKLLSASILTVLVPGAQGLTVIPIQPRDRDLYLGIQAIDPFEVPGPTEQPSTFRISVYAKEQGGGWVDFNFPFQVTTQTPWLRLESNEGTTPYELRATVDPKGFKTGIYRASVKISIGTFTQTQSLSFVVGPIPRVQPNPYPIEVLIGKPTTHKFTIQSSSSPLDFELMAQTPWLDVSPKTGRTPQEITVTVDGQSIPPQDYQPSGSIIIKSDGNRTSVTHYYLPLYSPIVFSPDTILQKEAAPGSLITFLAGTSRCNAATNQSAPWPRVLGSCILRVNGSPIPIQSIESRASSSGSRGGYNIIYRITAQLPYGLEGPSTAVEIEDSLGKRTTVTLKVKPAVPEFKEDFTTGPSYPAALLYRTGEELIVKLSGLGQTTTPAPLGDVATIPIEPTVPIEAFVGGKKAKILSVELSATEVGIFNVHIQIPEIARDLHIVSIRAGGTLIATGFVVVVE